MTSKQKADYDKTGKLAYQSQKQIAANVKFNHLAQIQQQKHRARETALMAAPTRKEVNGVNGDNEAPHTWSLTAKERLAEAEIIYKWLIKDLK